MIGDAWGHVVALWPVVAAAASVVGAVVAASRTAWGRAMLAVIWAPFRAVLRSAARAEVRPVADRVAGLEGRVDGIAGQVDANRHEAELMRRDAATFKEHIDGVVAAMGEKVRALGEHLRLRREDIETLADREREDVQRVRDELAADIDRVNDRIDRLDRLGNRD